MKKNALFLFLLLVVFSSCSKYEKLLKSNDNELKYTEAIKYYEKKSYLRSIALFEQVSGYYKGTEKSEDVLFYLAKANLENEDFFTANNYFTSYTTSFPKGKYAEEAWYYRGICFYNDSPEARLDQTPTTGALEILNEFLALYPNSSKVPEVNKLIAELTDKLAYKAYLNSKLYFDLGNYMGNNYISAIITAKNALEDYPDCKYKEELNFIILEAKFEQAEKSIATKKAERYRDTIDEYYKFINEFPEGKLIKDAKRIFNTSQRFVTENS